MTPWDVIQEATGLVLQTADGQRVDPVVNAGMPVDAIMQLESELGFELPGELSRSSTFEPPRSAWVILGVGTGRRPRCGGTATIGCSRTRRLRGGDSGRD
jgi:hypothetical protein